ncbi:[protein-PII] uridylyltransferase [Desulfatibacillum aliphaticivorans]|uniref:Bifunctional uridylyltransferase/uridylyl-removing enzyme n=1 Tax=Desulfatibacillum aliphaticivorans TaxID=218208 RepID=B8FDY7_DESAL|nr:[protein-PII] uridylyltransferase [Desulfatibacillum aliphaticivorans]ACL06768.1 UTP-GlnB uridylyltransferase, GlnD [Desulfatibacillum aliphaticivorans]
MNNPDAITNLTKSLEKLLTLDEPRELDNLHARAVAIDDYFRATFENSSVGPRMRVDKNPYALIALGGYGRREQCIGSDVDILFLFEKKMPDQATELVQEAIYPLWDLGMDVGHATRTLKECISLSSKDFDVLTPLLDARFICGMSPLYTRMMEMVHDKVLKGKTRTAFLKWLASTKQDRHDRYGDSSYLLEPNLKEGRGGLRDYHAMLWIGRIAHGVRDPRDLEYLGLLSHDEYATLTQALDFIWKVRNHLHHIAKRKCDQLFFEYQPLVAQALGFGGDQDLQGIEQFLKTLHRAMEQVKQRHKMFMLSALPRSRPGRPFKAVRPTKTPGIIVEKGAMVFEDPSALAKDPALLMEIFAESARESLPLSLDANRLVRDFAQVVDDSFRSDPRVVKAFEKVLSTPAPDFNPMEEMFATRFITAFIPEMGAIMDRIQYTHYHVFPVDKHSIKALQIVKSFASRVEDRRNHDLYNALYQEVPNKKTLHWAVLLHDVGKGSPDGGHSGRGARTARQILSRMGYGEAMIQDVEFLIREHLLLAKTATRRDLHDENTSLACARKVKDPDRLKMLFLLTVADSQATGPKAWNDWTSVLLQSLFIKTHHILTNGELATEEATRMVKDKRKQVLAAAPESMKREWYNLFTLMSPRYLQYTQPKEIVDHIRLYERLQGADAVIEAAPSRDANLRTVTVCAKDRPGLFSKIAGVLTLNNLNIFDAQIFTWRNHTAMDIFQVSPPLDSLFEKRTWQRVERDLGKVLSGEMDLSKALEDKPVAKSDDNSASALRRERVSVDNDSSGFFTIVEVIAYDQLGLLYKITDALYRCGLDIWVAKIATKADQVVDVFYVRDFDGQKVDSPESVDAIKQTVLETLHGERNNKGVKPAGLGETGDESSPLNPIH